MEEDHIIQQTAVVVGGSFELGYTAHAISEQELVLILSEKIAGMLERQPEQLMSLLYRLDVLEEKSDR